ncbi:uncharacterized protein K02A2.6-like [Biomphalaria glabrata]|uniref:Uncharacterized protein K02A2.6-like n=1 Tax=Biomphalaria glabrata TaxID=6526 RepID=A0A9W2ZFC4_BIOGL|nr:uncharacterized protein K02A2.6-like [Biomphalaria glabrata]
MKKEVYSTHSGIEGCLKRDRESLFWPGMTGDIKHYISTCEICQAFQPNQQKETLMNHEVPTHPWEKVGVDLFTLDGKDYYSNFCEVDRLENTSSETVIRKLKSHFAIYDIPSTVVSDNEPQLSSDSFAKFANDWSFNHLTSSPHYPRSNRKAESAVKTIKTLFLKNKDQFMALFKHRSTPNKTGTSLSQAFFNRRIRTLLPIAKSLLKPQVLDPQKHRKALKEN